MELITTSADRARVGGKGAQLLTLQALEMPVPAFFVIPPGESIDAGALIAARRALGQGDVAVRSSAVGEDGGTASFAGQFDSVLCVDTDDALVSAVQTILDSADSERVRVYCERHGLDPSATRMAVIVQRMFPSAVSGVMFTADPTAPADDTLLISAGYGLGEGIVSGHADADSIRVSGDESASTVTTEITDKHRMMVRAPSGGTTLQDVPELQRQRPCLTDDQARTLATIGRRLEAAQGRPQDIEWAFSADGELAILQTRALTGVGPRTGRLYTWDNSNIVESYSGVTSPLTYTFARAAYEVVYRQFCEVMGVPRADIQAHAPVFKAMIGLLRGRVYYRLDSWYQVLQLLPGAKYNKRFMEQMMGVRKQAELGGPPSRAGKLRILYLVWRMVRALGGLGRRTEHFKALFAEAYSRYHGRDLNELTAPELVEAYRILERDVLLNWKAPIINDFYAMIFFGVLKKMAPDHHNDLLCGEPGMESTLPTREVMGMAATIRATPALRAWFEASSNDAVIAAIRAGAPEPGPLTAWLANYLEHYGDRCMEELKLETPTLRDDPGFVIATLRNYVARDDLTIEALEARERSVRAAAEAAVSIPFGKRLLFKWILGRARRHVRERENLRFARTRIFGLVRTIFRTLGAKLVTGGLLDRADDVFYLGVEEIFGLVEGTTVSVDVRPIVAARRAEFARYRALPAPSDRFETRGAVHIGNPFIDTDPAPAVEGDVMQGLGCAPGVVHDRARVIHSPKDDLSVNGQIMVCERTDPGWVPLFPTAGGLLVERGSALSHSAIVAREFGIPTVVGLPGLLARIDDGQWVKLDGKAGTVQLDPGAPDDAEGRDGA